MPQFNPETGMYETSTAELTQRMALGAAVGVAAGAAAGFGMSKPGVGAGIGAAIGAMLAYATAPAPITPQEQVKRDVRAAADEASKRAGAAIDEARRVTSDAYQSLPSPYQDSTKAMSTVYDDMKAGMSTVWNALPSAPWSSAPTSEGLMQIGAFTEYSGFTGPRSRRACRRGRRGGVDRGIVQVPSAHMLFPRYFPLSRS